MATPAAIPWHSFLSLAAAMALVGSYVGLSKLLVVVFPVFLLAWLRFGIAAVAMATWVTRAPGHPPISTHDRRLLFLESFLGNFLFSICMLLGVARSSALAAGVVLSAIPGVVAILSRIFLRERIAPRVVMGILCAITGIAIVSLMRSQPLSNSTSDSASNSATGAASLIGVALLLGAVVCEASYVVIGKRLTGNVSAKRISALVNLWGLALVTPLGLWQATRFDFAAVQPASWALLVFYALAASMATVWLWMTGLKHVPASSAGVFTVFLPIGAAAVGILVLGERFSVAQTAAYGLALAGVVLATWPSRPTDRPR